MVQKRADNQEADNQLFFDQLCLKINQETKVQTEQSNKEDCQDSSAEKYRSSEHNGMERHDQEKMEGFQAKYLC